MREIKSEPLSLCGKTIDSTPKSTAPERRNPRPLLLAFSEQLRHPLFQIPGWNVDSCVFEQTFNMAVYLRNLLMSSLSHSYDLGVCWEEVCLPLRAWRISLRLHRSC